MAKVQTEKKYCRTFQPQSRAHERYRRQTDRLICDSVILT